MNSPPCAVCGHADSRDETHARGCPSLPPVTQEQLLELAESCRRNWERTALELGRGERYVPPRRGSRRPNV